MKTYRSALRTMKLVILVCQLGLILRTEAQTPDACIISTTNRPPENEDITVICGTEYMDLSIYLCPVYQALYNESLMVLNNEFTRPDCFGTADWTVDPPALKFRFPINESSLSSCNNHFKIINQVGSGEFSDFSNVQYVNISGTVTSVDPSAGMITYRPQILYKFSCLYPMQYLLNNTKLGVSGASLAINDNNGSFISTLSMHLYKDERYQEMLIIPQTGLNLKTKIYVAVKATNLTESPQFGEAERGTSMEYTQCTGVDRTINRRFNVLLDRCYATTNPYPMMHTYYDLFIGCNRDAQTKVEVNGESQTAYFSFEAFRFVEHKNQTISTFYLHCVTRLCEVSACRGLLPDCDAPQARRKRESGGVSTNATVTSPAIVVGKRTIDWSLCKTVTKIHTLYTCLLLIVLLGEAQPFSVSHGTPPESNYSSPVVAVIVCIVILAILLVAMAIYFALFIRRRKTLIQ